MIKVLDEDALDEVHVVDGENGLAEEEPAVVVMVLEPPVVLQHKVGHVLLTKEELLYGGEHEAPLYIVYIYMYNFG